MRPERALRDRGASARPWARNGKAVAQRPVPSGCGQKDRGRRSSACSVTSRCDPRAGQHAAFNLGLLHAFAVASPQAGPLLCAAACRLRRRAACQYSRYWLRTAPRIHPVLATTHHVDILEIGSRHVLQKNGVRDCRSAHPVRFRLMAGQPSRALTESRSSCSSLSVVCMRARPKSLTSTPFTIWYLPFLQVTG